MNRKTPHPSIRPVTGTDDAMQAGQWKHSDGGHSTFNFFLWCINLEVGTAQRAVRTPQRGVPTI